MKFTGRKRKLTDAEICALYVEIGDSVIVSIRAGCSSTTVLTIVRRGGGKIWPIGGRRKRGLAATDQEICDRYLAGESGYQIAQSAGTSGALIYSILERNGVPRRDRNWHRQVERAKKKKDTDAQ